MFNKAKKLIAAVVAAACMMTGAAEVFAAGSPVTAPKVPASVVENLVYSDITVDTATQTATKVVPKDNKVVVRGTYTAADSKTYAVTTVAGDAFKEAASVKKITLGKGVNLVKANAFSGAKKLKLVRVLNSQVTFEKGAFKGLKTKKITIKVTRKMSKKDYKKLVKSLRRAGFKGKIVKYGKKA